MESSNLKVVIQLLLKEALDGFKNGKNIAISPALLEVMTLFMVAAGAKGPALEQLLAFIGVERVEDVNFNSATLNMIALLSTYHNSDDFYKQQRISVELCLANGVWVNKRFPITPFCKEFLNYTFNVEPKVVDFQHQVFIIYIYSSWS